MFTPYPSGDTLGITAQKEHIWNQKMKPSTPATACLINSVSRLSSWPEGLHKENGLCPAVKGYPQNSLVCSRV